MSFRVFEFLDNACEVAMLLGVLDAAALVCGGVPNAVRVCMRTPMETLHRQEPGGLFCMVAKGVAILLFVCMQATSVTMTRLLYAF